MSQYVKIEVIVEIDTDQLDELEFNGENSGQVDERICNSITLTPSNMRQPVHDISSVRIVDYFEE